MPPRLSADHVFTFSGGLRRCCPEVGFGEIITADGKRLKVPIVYRSARAQPKQNTPITAEVRILWKGEETMGKWILGLVGWLRGVDLNHRPLGYEPNELPDCSTPRVYHSNLTRRRQF